MKKENAFLQFSTTVVSSVSGLQALIRVLMGCFSRSTVIKESVTVYPYLLFSVSIEKSSWTPVA